MSSLQTKYSRQADTKSSKKDVKSVTSTVAIAIATTTPVSIVEQPPAKQYNFTLSENPPTKKSSVTFARETNNSLADDLLGCTNDDVFYDDDISYKLSDLFKCYDGLKRELDNGKTCLSDLCDVLETVYTSELKALKRMLSDGKVTFKGLEKIITIGKEVVGRVNFGERVGAIVTSSRVSSNGLTRYLLVTGNAMVSNGDTYVPKQVQFVVYEFTGLKQVNSLSVRLMSSEDKQKLETRGREYLKYSMKHHYKEYMGSMVIQTCYGPALQNASGRVVIDTKGHNKHDPNSYFNDDDDEEGENSELTNGLSNDQSDELGINDQIRGKLHLLWPYLPAFSLITKSWGELFIKNIREITFDDDAYSKLVMDEDKKKLVRTLVVNSKHSFTDIISNKSGGCIFLLYGPPGTGKTLTSESISELLHVPLYSVTSGELGTYPDNLEQKLSSILTLAQSWGANILIDEADVFLEKRDSNNLERNAIVSIFLRLLERYNGIMFLTTNRKTDIDEAFQSRISISLEYKELDKDSRRQVFNNLLSAAHIETDENTLKKYSDKKINGRQIKNLIRLAQTLAIDENCPVSQKHFDSVWKICEHDYINKSETGYHN